MVLEYLTILVEKPGTKYQFAKGHSTIVAMFNPDKLTLARSVQWGNQKAAKRDNPEMQFTGGDPMVLTIDLLFDTYDTPYAKKESVCKYTDKLTSLTKVEQHGEKHRPPLCRLQWGVNHAFFDG